VADTSFSKKFETWLKGAPLLEGGTISWGGAFGKWFKGAPVVQTTISDVTTSEPPSGMTFGGAAEVCRTFAYVADCGHGAGGWLPLLLTQVLADWSLEFGGAATVAHTNVVEGSGGLTFGGSADCEFVPAPTTYEYIASGGMVLGGSAVASTLRVYEFQATGGLTFGGSAAASLSVVVEGSGGLTLGGAAGIARTLAYEASGGLELAGGADVSLTRVWEASGGLELGGTAEIARTFASEAAGGLVLGGSAVVAFVSASGAVVYTFTASGGMTLGGAASVVRTYAFMPSGGLVLGGSASVLFLPAGATEPPGPGAPQTGGGIALPVRLPFWPVPGVRVRALIVSPAGVIRGEVRCDEDEMMSEEYQLLGLL
jgi:hypothetical protein